MWALGCEGGQPGGCICGQEGQREGQAEGRDDEGFIFLFCSSSTRRDPGCATKRELLDMLEMVGLDMATHLFLEQ